MAVTQKCKLEGLQGTASETLYRLCSRLWVTILVTRWLSQGLFILFVFKELYAICSEQ